MGGAGQILLVAGALALAVLTLRSDYRPKAARRAQFRAAAAESAPTGPRPSGGAPAGSPARGVQEYRKRRPGPRKWPGAAADGDRRAATAVP